MGISQLNLTELFRRIGAAVGGDTEVDLSRTARLTIGAGDLSHLVPPIAVPVGGGRATVAAAGVGTFAQFTFQSLAAGGCFSLSGVTDGADLMYMWKSQTNPFGALTPVVSENFAFGQVARSVFSRVTVAGAAVNPAGAPAIRGTAFPQLAAAPIFIGAGEFLNFESDDDNAALEFSFYWQEIPAPQSAIAPPA